MPTRWGLGPVFAVESLMNARRRTIYAGRSLFVLALLLGLVVVWAGNVDLTSAATTSGSIQDLSQVGEQFYYTLAQLQLWLALLAAPAATAGAICLDRARGGLTHLLVTDLSDVEIVLGKLSARLAPVVGLLACSLPVTAMAVLLGGIDAGAMTGAFVVSLAVALFGCSLAMTVSVWANRPHEVIMTVFLFWTAALLALPLWEGTSIGSGALRPPDWLEKLNPFILIMAPYSQPGFVTAIDYVIFFIAALMASALLNGLTVATLRRSMMSGGPTDRPRGAFWRRIRNLLPGPTLDGNPVLWREWHRARPSRLARIAWTVFAVASVLGTTWGVIDVVQWGVSLTRANGLMIVVALEVVLGLLMASVSAPTALGEERVRGSFDLLLATPMSTRSIVLGKWLGAFRVVPWLALLPIVAAIAFAWQAPGPTGPWPTFPPITPLARVMVPVLMACQILSFGAAITSLGLALATLTPRVGRAVGLNVSAFILLTVGWPILTQIALGRSIKSDDLALYFGILSLSPFLASFLTLQVLTVFATAPDISLPDLWIAQGVSILAVSAFAAVVLWLTLWRFDRCLGRVPERESKRALARRRSHASGGVPR